MVNVPWCHKHDEPYSGCNGCSEEKEEQLQEAVKLLERSGYTVKKDK